MGLDIAALILTKNEEIHIERCILSIKKLVSKIYVIDSYSTDNTKNICLKYDVQFLENKFYNYSTQFNWGLEIIKKNNHRWVIRIDSDEIFTPKLIDEIQNLFGNINQNLSGISLKRKIIFNDKILNYGGTSSYQLRIFRPYLGFCENRFMDEHIKVQGKIKFLKQPFFDHNLKNLSWWTQKHNLYSNREVIDLLELNQINEISQKGDLSENNKYKRFFKVFIYGKTPILIRAFIYFLYRYIGLLGFLDGRSGLIYNLLQGFWYRFLIDAKIIELKNFSKKNNISLRESAKIVFDIDL